MRYNQGQAFPPVVSSDRNGEPLHLPPTANLVSPPPEDLAARLRTCGLEQVLCNLPAGDPARGERGVAALPGREEVFAIAGNPSRHEPDVGEIHYPRLFDLIDELGYTGWIGCEYRPRGDTMAGLGWAHAYGLGMA